MRGDGPDGSKNESHDLLFDALLPNPSAQFFIAVASEVAATDGEVKAVMH